ncbi:DUF3237 domain-containing protein [Kribbella sp. NPDC048915]|uniref:DUF3237 domain-containing protein n=1 Tax=Kribbella sp. NPDC048915 TaxID=3155148 RepID=UPI0033D00343
MQAQDHPAIGHQLQYPSAHQLEDLCSLDIFFGDVPSVPTPTGTRMLFAVQRGIVEGPKLSGAIVPGSIDWVTVGDDAIARVEVKAVIRTHDDALIQLTTTGRAQLGPQLGRFLAGELVTADEAYIRTSPLFETKDPRYTWLNHLVTVARCDLSTSRIRYRISALS